MQVSLVGDLNPNDVYLELDNEVSANSVDYSYPEFLEEYPEELGKWMLQRAEVLAAEEGDPDGA